MKELTIHDTETLHIANLVLMLAAKISKIKSKEAECVSLVAIHRNVGLVTLGSLCFFFPEETHPSLSMSDFRII